MIKAYKAFTMEIDEAELAAAELLAQLDLKHGLLTHSVGILTCHYEFVHSGAVKAICDAMPFDVVGVSTTAQAVHGGSGILALTMLVLTSDTVAFSTACSTALSQGLESPIHAACQKAAAGRDEAPGLALLFAPLLLQYAGDQYVELVHAELGGSVPIFGTLSMDDTSIYDECYTIYNGECAHDTLALLYLYGDVQPAFFHITLSSGNVLSRPARITKSEGNILKEINGQPFVRFLEGLGLARDGKIRPHLQLLVVVIDYKDGTPPVGKVLIQLSEEGYGICGGYMPEGMELSIASLTKEDVLATTRLKTREAMEYACRYGKSVMLGFSCNTRNIALGSDVNAEFDAIDEIVGGGLPYLISLSGGEICPHVDGDAIYNRFHNNTFIVCVF